MMENAFRVIYLFLALFFIVIVLLDTICMDCVITLLCSETP
jgi:hypothetical protein